MIIVVGVSKSFNLSMDVKFLFLLLNLSKVWDNGRDRKERLCSMRTEIFKPMKTDKIL